MRERFGENSRVLLITPLSESDKRKRKKKDVDAAEEGTVIEQNTGIEDNDIVTPKKKKKHQKEVAELSQDGLSDTLKHDKDNLSVNGTLEEESPRKSKKKHKKEKRKITEEDVSLVNGALDIDDSIASLTSCEPLFTSTQVDDVNNNEGGKKKSKKHKKKHKVLNDTNDSEIDPDSLLQSDSLDPTTECSINESELTDSKHEIENKHKKSRKRTHGESNFTLIKEKIVKQDLDFAEPSPIKKLKKQKKVVEIDMDSSADFEDTSKSIYFAIKFLEEKGAVLGALVCIF
ncbi:uncharacterized protein LOC132754692 [Ruditapes philippinarum]|uniref:uncharacterized protein LOC132754692 n=1 Tax=Ruditapes philippinarum TaxID=129788 RepID=UPI00295AA329|nr:uncharacterized protein LOC132754692 [Ruditapes philippinarum]